MTVASPPTTVTIPTDQLVERLTAAARIATSQGSFGIPGIRWTLAGGHLALEAVGRELAFRTLIAVQGEAHEVSFTLPAKTSLQIAKAFRTPFAEFAVTDSAIEITAGAMRLALKHLVDTAVPPMPALPEGEPARIPAGDLRASIDKVASSAAGPGEARQILQGVLVNLDGNHLAMVATDAYRITTKDQAIGGQADASFSAVIPAKTLSEVSRLAAGDDTAPVELRVSDTRVAATAGQTTLVGRLCDGQYPNYRQLMAYDFNLKTSIATAELRSALANVKVCGEELVILRFADGQVTVSARSVEVGEVSEAIPLAWPHEDLEIGFNVDLLRAGVELVESAETQLALVDPLKPMTITDEGNASYTHLLMPRRTGA